MQIREEGWDWARGSDEWDFQDETKGVFHGIRGQRTGGKMNVDLKDVSR